MSTTIINDGWKLESLSVTKKWSQDSNGEYTARIRFSDNKNNEVTFNVPPEKVQQLLNLVADSIVDSARQLGQGLVQSMRPHLPPPPEDSGKDQELPADLT